MLIGGEHVSGLVNPATQKKGQSCVISEDAISATSEDKSCTTSQEDKMSATLEDARCVTPQRKRAWTQATIVSSMVVSRAEGGNEENEGGDEGEIFKRGEFGRNKKRIKRGRKTEVMTEQDKLLYGCASNQFSLSRTKAVGQKR